MTLRQPKRLFLQGFMYMIMYMIMFCIVLSHFAVRLNKTSIAAIQISFNCSYGKPQEDRFSGKQENLSARTPNNLWTAPCHSAKFLKQEHLESGMSGPVRGKTFFASIGISTANNYGPLALCAQLFARVDCGRLSPCLAVSLPLKLIVLQRGSF